MSTRLIPFVLAAAPATTAARAVEQTMAPAGRVPDVGTDERPTYEYQKHKVCHTAAEWGRVKANRIYLKRAIQDRSLRLKSN